MGRVRGITPGIFPASDVLIKPDHPYHGDLPRQEDRKIYSVSQGSRKKITDASVAYFIPPFYFTSSQAMLFAAISS